MSGYLLLFMLAGGALLYGLASNPKVAEIGRLAMMAALFALAFEWAGHTISLVH